MNSYDFMPGVPAAGHVAGGCWHPGTAGTCHRCAPPEPRYGRDTIHRGDTVTWAQPGRQDAEGTVRLVYNAGVLVHRRAYLIPWDRITGHEPVRAGTDIDPDAVRRGDTITYAGTSAIGQRGSAPELEAVVDCATASGVRVTRLGRAYLVGWPRVLTHSPRARTGKAAGDA